MPIKSNRVREGLALLPQGSALCVNVSNTKVDPNGLKTVNIAVDVQFKLQ